LPSRPLDTPQRLWIRVRRRLQRCTRGDLLVFLPGPLRISGPGLVAEIERAEAALSNSLLLPGAKVLVQVSHPLPLLVLLPALWGRGCIPILSDRISTGSDDDDLVHHLAPDAILTDAAATATDSKTVWLPPLPVLRLHGPHLRRVLPLPPGTVLVRTTSGSTGRPRGVALSAEQILSDARNIAGSLRLSDSLTSLAAIPMSHAFGFSTLLTPMLFLGIPMVLLEQPVPELFRKALGRHESFFFPGIPLLFDLLLGSSLSTRFLERLKIAVSAGARLSPSTALLFRERTGIPLRNFYGTSECGAIACDRTAAGLGLPECVGTPLKGVRLSLRRDARRSSRPHPADGERGRIRVEGESVALGYVGAGARPRLFHGWFATGDLGRWGSPGALFLEGRLDRMINVGGRKVFPEEVERAILEAPGVREAVVLGISDPLRGEVVAAVVAGAATLRESTLMDFCRARLAAPRLPRRILILGELPRTARGKLDAARLRALLGGDSCPPNG
jgi:acyl-CoA synthetase (AMP-forming)/AMP-acid ligase II